MKPKTEASGVAVESDVKPTWNAGLEAPLAKTWTRVGMWVAPSIAICTEPTSDRESRGTRLTTYAGRPATVAVESVRHLRARVDRLEGGLGGALRCHRRPGG